MERFVSDHNRKLQKHKDHLPPSITETLTLEKGIDEELRKELGHATSRTTLKHYARGREEEVAPVSVECPWEEKGPFGEK